MLAGTECAHALAYRIVYPQTSVRWRVLIEAGHSYMGWAPVVLGLGAGVVAAGVASAVVDVVRRRKSGRCRRGRSRCSRSPDSPLRSSRTVAHGWWRAVVDGRAADLPGRGRPAVAIRVTRLFCGSGAASGWPHDRQDLGRQVSTTVGWSVATGSSCRNCFFPPVGTPARLEYSWAAAAFCLIR